MQSAVLRENHQFYLYCCVCNAVCNSIVSAINCSWEPSHYILLSHYLVTLTLSLSLSLSRHYHFLTTACLESPPSLFEPFRICCLAIQIFLDFSPRLSSSRHVALREKLGKLRFLWKTLESYDCLEKLRFLSRDGSFWRPKSPKKVRNLLNSKTSWN
jgi:hypothetical protein